MRHLTAPELAAWLADPTRAQPLLLDVREDHELARCRLPGSTAIVLHTLPARLDELDPEAEVVCICHHGARSQQAAAFLERNGFSQVSNLTGGIHAWALQVDPTMPTY